MGVVTRWDSRRVESESHPVKGVNQMWFRTKADAEKYRTHRRLQERAGRAGFPRDQEGVRAFKALENSREKKKLTHKKKIERIQRLIDRGDQSLSDFAHAVINIVEDRSH